ncbi:hypothetical protein EDC04DRAFT_3146424 [Pisolithus marmoratus]|nr:hypothetical protein EDC04DRAFT_3146424 [Pisolithus marmoratus]
MQCQQSQQAYAPVTVDMRALIDKVLARYSGEFTVFRELLQNSDDAGCDAAEIRFETAVFVGLNPEAAMKTGPPMLAELQTVNVSRWTFRNHGKPFTPQDWDRLPRIALGNPDPRKVGAFGVGFYSLFSVTERPCVSSGGREMEFLWNDENQLYYRFSGLPQTTTKDLWTTFKMPLREDAPMPPVSEFMQFLSSSITFMVHLKDVTVFFDNHPVGQINKSVGQTKAIRIPTELERSSSQKIMFVESVQQYPITIKAKIMHPQYGSMHKTTLDLTVFTADVEVTVGEKLTKELRRCIKKDPPSRLKYSLIYTGKDEYDQSYVDEQKHPREFPSPFRGLRADLDGATHTRLFIGHATAQTTGIGGHMASYFIPTVERESIDLVDRNVAIWNRELLYVGGFLCRAVYEWELSKIQNAWEEAAAGKQLQDQRFLHLLKFFTFHHSTPSPQVAKLLMKSFYGCSTLPLLFLSSVGVCRAPDVRAFDMECAKFVKSLPMLSEDATGYCEHFITRLPDQHKIGAITPSDVVRDLRCHNLDVEELVACLRWWITITSRRDDWNPNTDDLLDAATLRGTCGTIRLSSITYFIDPEALGLHIPPNGPLPLSLIPLDIGKHFNREGLISFGWKEFTVASWLQYISHPEVMSADEQYDFTRSTEWASCVLITLRRVWPRLSEDMRRESRDVFSNKPCIPTSKALHCPECSYLPIVDNALFDRLGLPIVSRDLGFEVDEDMKRFLLFIGVRKNPPVQNLLDQMLLGGDWTMFDLVDYLLREQSSLTSEDYYILKSSEIFCAEEETTLYRVNELYPPVEIFRSLGLPVIKWSRRLEWMDTLPEAQLLYDLGLNHFPPLRKIVELCSSRHVEVQGTAFEYLCNNLQSQYPHYKPENFRDVEFIPAESRGRTCLRRLGEVYSGTQWKPLGFSVVQDRYLSAPLLHQLGIAQHPSSSKLLDLLETTPPPDEETAVHWFEALVDHIRSFSHTDLTKLSGLPIVPTGPSNALKLLPPTKCYLDQGAKSPLYAKLFVFVDFGPDANYFLSICGSKNTVSVDDVAEILAENPERFCELAGGYEGFLRELRNLASHSQDISLETLHKLSHKPALLGIRRKKREGKAGWDYEHRFLTSQGITIVDDIDHYHLFSDCLFIAPRDKVLESFYGTLGCSLLSKLVKERWNDLREVPATETSLKVQSLILARLPLFIQNYSDAEPIITVPSSPDHFKVKACKKIVVSKALVTGNVKRTRDVWAIARHEGGCVELWISKMAKRDMYDVATSLCRLLFGSVNMDAARHLETILSGDLAHLERKGFLDWSGSSQRLITNSYNTGDQTSQQRRHRHGAENEAKKERSTGSASTTNSPQQSTLDSQPDPQLSCKRLPGTFEATPQFPPLSHSADSASLKVYGTSNVVGDEPLDTVRHCASLSRPSGGVIPLTYIRNNVDKAIKACSSGGENPAIHVGVNQFLSSDFCRVSADVGRLLPIGKMKNVVVCVDEGMSNANTFMERMHGPLARFVDIITALSKIYGISTTNLRVFYDVSGGCIAFNCRGTIYLNLRYFETWHNEQVKSGNRRNAEMSWFLALAHEIAHNLTDLHNSDHEFWFSAICEAHLIALSKLLQPPAGTWLGSVLWLVLTITVILLAYIIKRVAPVTPY